MTAIFKFRNVGKEPVEITKLKSSCDCTTAELNKKRYEPGESGEITSVFTIGERIGDQFKQITVQTNEGGARVQRLSFHVRLPELARIAPIAVFWERGQKPAPQSIQIQFPEKEMSAQAVKVTGTTNLTEARLKMTEAGRSYQLEVSPRATDSPWREEIAIDVTFEGLGVRRYKCYAYVK